MLFQISRVLVMIKLNHTLYRNYSKPARELCLRKEPSGELNGALERLQKSLRNIPKSFGSLLQANCSMVIAT